MCAQDGCSGAGPDWGPDTGLGLRHNTLYIGGGTPSVLPLEDMGRIVRAVANAADLACDMDGGGQLFEEFTVEVNPDDIVSKGLEYVEGLLSLGVNRISMGVQAMDDNVLRWMNRRHDVETARKAYRIISSAGIGNISIDLIFGYSVDGASGPGHWKNTVAEALDIAGDGSLPKHISAYQLSVDDGSALAGMVKSGKYKEASDEMCALQYSTLCAMLADAGYRHYEISNFAQPGYEAKHNSAYWRHIPYVGLGPSAHSFSGLSEDECAAAGQACKAGGEAAALHGISCVRPCRTWNKDDVAAYIKAAENGSWESVVSGESLDGMQLREEEIMLSLRTDRGISRRYLEMDESIRPAIEKFIASGALVPLDAAAMAYYGFPESESRLRIPEDHFFVSDDIISELL